MSRLDSMIRRLRAQRDGIEWAGRRISDLGGDVLEVGLGNGRTYDHLREKLPEREIWVIEREPAAHPKSTPPSDRLLVGEADAGLAELARRGVRVALIHYDLGVGIADVDHPLAAGLSPAMAALLVPGGIVLANNPLVGLPEIKGPDTVPLERYFFYRKPDAERESA